MSHTPHELHDEFPDAAELLHELKTGNAHFAAITEQYHVLNRQIHRIDSGVEASSDERSEALKKQRLAMLDEIAQALAAHKVPLL